MQIISWKSCDSIHNKITVFKIIIVVLMYMLWFKISFGAKFLKLVQFLFSFVVYSLPWSGTMANKIETNSKNFKPKINLNHNIYHLANMS